MPRSFLVKKKAAAVGMPRLAGEATSETGHPDGGCCSPVHSIPTPSIFSPAVGLVSPTHVETTTNIRESSSPLSGLSPPSGGRSHDSPATPEPINYSLGLPHTPTSPAVSPLRSPSLSPEPCHPHWPSSPEMHLPYLALSFKRLQEMHLKAVESRLQGMRMGSGGPSPAALTTPSSPVRSPQQPSSPTSSPASETRGDLGVLPLPMASPHQAYTWPQEHPYGVVPMDMDKPQPTGLRRRRDGDPPRYQCEACNKSYATFSGLSKHKQFHCTALIKKEFICKHCDKKYVSLGALKMHIRTHTLPCKCHICGKAFSRPWLLQGHVRTHTGEKPFPCNHCGRSFADRSNLRAHLQTHTDIKKYNCQSCSKSFSRSSLLHKHMDNGCGAASPTLSARSL